MTLLFGATTTAGWYTYYQTALAYLLRKWPKIKEKAAFILSLIHILWLKFHHHQRSDGDAFFVDLQQRFCGDRGSRRNRDPEIEPVRYQLKQKRAPARGSSFL